MSSQVEQRAAVAPLARQELARRHPADFLSTLVPSYQRTPHTEALCDVLERLEAREINRVIICMPPRHGKTLHVSQAFPAWCLGRHPDAQIILASYSAELAEQNSRRGRGFLLDPRWPFSGVAVSAESAAVNRWHTTRGGGVIAAGVRGGLTGFGADVLVVDDAVRDRAEADSEAARASAWEWFAQVALTRLQPNAAVLVMGTRWHEDDLIGRILDSPSAGEWTLLSLPALAEENDPLGRLEGEALWPAWYPKERLEALRQEIGERAFLALYQQRPSSERGGVFRREWMSGRYAGLPARCTTVIQSADSAFKVGVANDYSVVSTWATDGRYFYLVDVWRRRVEFPELVAAIKAQTALHSPSSIVIEDTASAQSAIQVLRRDSALPIIAVPAAGSSKVSRAEAVSPLFEAGRVLLPEQQPAWLGPWIEEHVSFPTAKHDDQVDTTSMALARLRTHGGGGAADVGGEPLLGWRARVSASLTPPSLDPTESLLRDGSRHRGMPRPRYEGMTARASRLVTPPPRRARGRSA